MSKQTEQVTERFFQTTDIKANSKSELMKELKKMVEQMPHFSTIITAKFEGLFTADTFIREKKS